MDLTMNKPKTFPILLVEDNPGDARLVREMLTEVASTEFDVQHVERLSEARERLMRAGSRLRAARPLAAGREPARGADAAESRGARRADRDPSGLQDELLAVKAVQEGAQDYLIKGRVDGDSLGRSISYAIERKRAEQELAAPGDARRASPACPTARCSSTA